MNKLLQITFVASVAAMIPFMYAIDMNLFLGQIAALLCGMFLRPYVQRRYCIAFLSMPIILDIINLLRSYPSIMQLILTMIIPFNLELGGDPRLVLAIITTTSYVMSILASFQFGIVLSKNLKLGIIR